MTKQFRAYRIDQSGGEVRGRVETLEWSDLAPLDVIIEGKYSGVNYKDALAATGKGKILRRFPLIGGIDVMGTVVAAKAGGFQPGEAVLITGCNLGESMDGGYSEFIAAPASSVIRLPTGLSAEEAMLIGTAGFTAALALYRLEQNDQTPSKGPVVVTGASGGVGSIAVDLLASQGYEVWAITGKSSARPMLERFGARRVLDPRELELGTRPLEAAKFSGVIDNVGGELLARLIPHVDLWGNVAAIGLTGGSALETTVMPFILRGVSVLGISSNNCPLPLRQELWRRLSGLWKPPHLQEILAKTIGLDQLDQAFHDVLERKITGRILVDLKKRG